MIIFILGIMDILSAISLFGIKFSMGMSVAWVFFAYLLIKSILFIRSWSSVVDLIVAGLFLAAMLGWYNIFTAIGILWLLQKGIISLF